MGNRFLRYFRYKVILVATVLLLLLYNLGYLIVEAQPLRKADAILLLMGGGDERIDFAEYLFKNHYGSVIYIVNPATAFDQSLNRNGVLIRITPYLIRSDLVKRGVDSNAVHVLPGPSKNTIGEGRIFARFCSVNKEIKDVLVSTSNYHSGRAFAILQNEMKKADQDVNIIVPNNIYSHYEPSSWFTSEDGRANTLSEAAKWMYYLFWSRWFT